MTFDVTNVALLLSETANRNPEGLAVAMPTGRDGMGKFSYRTITFRELDQDSSRLAYGLQQMGVDRSTRLALMVPQSIEFVSWVFALFKAGVVQILIDPGMGRRNMIRCLREARPDGFVGIPLAQAARSLMRRRFPAARLNVTEGRRWFWRGPRADEFRALELDGFKPADTARDDAAAIIFTTGSTGPPKGVLYQHGNFIQQAEQIQQAYGIEAGEVDLPGFPLFALFNCAMGVSTIIPEMDPTKPALVDPNNIVDAIEDWKVTQMFGSPAMLNTIGRYCEKNDVSLPTVKRVLSAGAPVPIHVLERMKKAIHEEGEIHTPYGATEALPVASISASEVLNETATLSVAGRGTCVGRRYPRIEWKVIRITDEPLDSIDQIEELPAGDIGELMVSGPVVTDQYVTRVDANRDHKVQDGERFWHRMGDVGYLDEDDRFWMCGRKSHRVTTLTGTLFTIPCEAIFNNHPSVYRAALVGIGKEGRQRPVIVVETWPEHRPRGAAAKKKLIEELKKLAEASHLTRDINDFLIHPSLPVDIRHNAKIFREKLRPWAARRVSS